MNQEIQLSLTPPQTLPQQPSSWTGPVSSALAQPPAQHPTPLATMHQHLRGRYILTAMLAAIFAGIGGIAGFMAPHPGYSSVGRFTIDPVKPGAEGNDVVMIMYTQYVNTVCGKFRSERVIREAMQNPAWKKHRQGSPDTFLAEWTRCLLVKPVPNSSMVEVTFTADGKDAEVIAPIAVTSLMKAYTDLYGDDQKHQLDRQIEVLVHQSASLAQQISDHNKLIDSMIHTDGDNPQDTYLPRLTSNLALEARIREIAERVRVERDELQKDIERNHGASYSVEDLARVDPAMQEMYRVTTAEDLSARELTARLGLAHPTVKLAIAQVGLRRDAMNKYAADLSHKYFIKMKADGTGGMLMLRDLSVEENELSHMQDLWTHEQESLADLGRRSHQIVTLRDEKHRFDEDRVRTERKIDELRNMVLLTDAFKVVDPGGQATIANDRRIALGALGFIIGGGLPVGLLLLASLMNPRFRFSDEATGQPIAGLTLLGILPDLPDRLSDPEQASIAAHCVHQIRTMLQINTAGTDDRRVFAITSAAPGDGKTSLTLALGLSYAACGTRTLLIDCDLIGAGLSARMNVAAADGVLEAIAHRSLLEYVHATDITDVSILPVGNSQNLHASTLSPAALRRLIEEARKHFDTILIDTGPVLGSIEASLVAAAADAVVLTVSRGQQRPLVERTVQHLQAIKATLAGVVFNRAQTADFDRSISGLSLRSAAAGHGHNAPRVGPVARAVQSAFKPAGSDYTGTGH